MLTGVCVCECAGVCVRERECVIATERQAFVDVDRCVCVREKESKRVRVIVREYV